MFEATEKLAELENPLDWTEEKTEALVAATRELCLHYQDRCLAIQHLYQRYEFDPASLVSESDLSRIPLLGVTAMKAFLMLSGPESDAVLKLTSSGTKGQKTQIWFDEPSLRRVQSMLRQVWKQERLISEKPTNYLMFIYDPSQAKDLGTAFTRKNQQQFAPPNRTHYAITQNAQGEWVYDKSLVFEVLKSYSAEGLPVRLCGIPSFVGEFLEWLSPSQSLRLPEESYVITGGGWKAAEDKKIPKETFRARLQERLGLRQENIRDGFGMAEHSAPCIECEHHRFHVPAYSRFLIRDVVTKEVLPPGQVGMLSLITAYNTLMPNAALLSTDLGYLDEERCPCGKNSPTFVPVGRGGITKHKGCALTAAELVKRV